MAYADGRLFVPVVELCSQESAVTSKSAFARPPAQGKGSVYALDAATGKTVWQRPLGSAPFGCATVARDAVIVPTYDGRVVAFAAADGRTLWHTQLRAGNNSCPAVGKDVLVVAAGATHPGIAQSGHRGRRVQPCAMTRGYTDPMGRGASRGGCDRGGCVRRRARDCRRHAGAASQPRWIVFSATSTGHINAQLYRIHPSG